MAVAGIIKVGLIIMAMGIAIKSRSTTTITPILAMRKHSVLY
jgi:hypothetical protein